MNRLALFVAVTTLLLLPFWCLANDWYVAPSGSRSDSASDGSENDPWSGFGSIRWGSGGVVAGDTVHLLEGRYLESILVGNSGEYAQPIVIVCDAPGACVIDGEGVRHSGMRGIDISNVVITGISATGHTNSGIRFEGTGSNITIRGCNAYQNSQYGIFVVTTSGIMSQLTIVENVAYGNGTPPTLTIPRGNGAGIFIATGDTGVIDDVVIQKNNAYSNRGRYGIGVYANFGGSWVDGRISNVVVSGNKANGNGGAGIDFSKNVTASRIFDNDAYGNGLDEPGGAVHLGGVDGSFVNDVEVYGNRVGNQKVQIQDGAGILIDDYVNHVYVYGNLVENNEESGVKLHNSDTVDIYANLIIDNKIAVKTPGAKAYRIYNNTIVSASDTGIDIYPQTTSAFVANNIIMETPLAIRVQYGVQNVQYVNNCIDSGAGEELLMNAENLLTEGNVKNLPQDAIFISEAPKYTLRSASTCNINGVSVNPLRGYDTGITPLNIQTPLIGAFQATPLPVPFLNLSEVVPK